MRKLCLLLFVIILTACNSKKKESQHDFTTLFEKSKGTETPVYSEVIDYYKSLTDVYSELSVFEIGETDSGFPLHLVVFDSQGKRDLESLKSSKKTRILINNGIHPGESDGIDASMLLLRDIVQNDSLKKVYSNTIIGVIPVYNVGGALNRNSHSRANQNGPKEYGFRGNARNFDLNRDFIKQDTKNAAAFAEIFHVLEPDIFIDNHVSNGADYQYAITHLFTQHNKLGGSLGNFLEKEMRPYIENHLAKKNIPITPYVNVWGSTPEKGFSQFYDSPRYSTGYTTLFNTLGFMVETHMLKPYKIRVEQTYNLMIGALDFGKQYQKEIKSLRAESFNKLYETQKYPISFVPNRESPSVLNFKGYDGSYIDSKVTTGKRLFYDRTKPFTKEIEYYNNFIPVREIDIPRAYVLESGWHKVIERLENNKIEFIQFEKDTTILSEIQHIKEYNTRKSAYEGHYLHYDTSVEKTIEQVTFNKGDIYIPTQQKGIRYIIETLEASATDSFFNWNFFDTILQRKEGFSAYVFEDIAEKILKENSKIKSAFENKMENDESFANNSYAQLNFIYKQSPHYEKAHLKLPIYKIY
ncbi:Zinc carboxypeptidase [Tenacibaculum sp. MAR_2009_124]|uniref:M14 family metallopeptidase n=1 Tax=Tenacibaculum sp. MAR_2009_124 TaxID=1250059 RepID=UPI00089A30BA|nr:M14 family metallopeptidase [Tenacibaculum sp. MAR_2009_124]SEC95115.1 Zinc carboxypeptidase [Tenacibaculum sp. MAR_2009_124]